MATENYCNTFPCTLMTSITTGTTLLASQATPIDGGFRILIDYELMLVTSGGLTTTWTITRGPASRRGPTLKSGTTTG